jgi:hypothetical protein
MANVNRPNGLTPVKTLSGSPYNGAVTRYVFLASDNTATFVGDPVKLSGDAHTDGTAAIAQAAAGNALLGVLVALEPDPTNLTLKHRSASTLRYAYVADDPNLIFEIQEDSAGGDIALASVGLCADVVVGSGNTTTGISGTTLDSSDVATDTGGQLRIIGAAQRADNVVPDTYGRWNVLINEHQLRTATDI